MYTSNVDMGNSEGDFDTEFRDAEAVVTESGDTVLTASLESVTLICPECGSVGTDATETACEECGEPLVADGADEPGEQTEPSE